MKTISAAEANRHFSALLRAVSRGDRVTITSRGRPVATIAAAEDQGVERGREAARRTLLTRLGATPATGTRTWSRDELYE